ncbi:MAG: peptide deformylase [Candidatus Paceibacterota bacterium]
MNILTINDKKEEKILRRKTPDFDFSGHKREEIQEMIKKMREAIKKESGIGLSANQLGSDWRLFIAQIPSDEGKPKFYAIFNPNIIKLSKDKTALEEGCLSVPGLWGLVERPEQITITGFEKNGKKIKIKAWGLLARVFQHEIDHLNGILFIDRTNKLFKEAQEETANI